MSGVRPGMAVLLATVGFFALVVAGVYFRRAENRR